jgi:hypothetical protein
MGKVKLDGYICERCEHTWISREGERKSGRDGREPIVCPKCKSPYWNIPRRRKLSVVREVTEISKKRKLSQIRVAADTSRGKKK